MLHSYRARGGMSGNLPEAGRSPVATWLESEAEQGVYNGKRPLLEFAILFFIDVALFFVYC